MMKKRLLALILSVLLFTTTIGCGSARTTYHILDAVTGLPVTGVAVINGKTIKIKNGVVSTKAKEIMIEKDGYEKAEFNNTKTLKLTPVAFLKLNAKPTPEEIYVDGVKYPLFFKGDFIILSPLKNGYHQLTFKGNFIKETTISVRIAKGENKISVNLLLNTESAYSFLSKMKFPEELKNAEFTINIKGTVDKENMNYTFNAKVQNGKTTEISDKNISYQFKDGTPFIKNNGVFIPVEDKETVAALCYARDVLQNILKLREFIKPLSLIDIFDSKALFMKQRDFENRPFDENITLHFNENAVDKVIINVKSPIENADFAVTVEIRAD